MQPLFAIAGSLVAFAATTSDAFVPALAPMGSCAGNRQMARARSVARAPAQRAPKFFMCTAEEGASAEQAPAPVDVEAAAAEGGEEPAEVAEPAPLTPEQMARQAKLEEIERLRAKEKFIVKETGDYECMSCAFVYKATEAVIPGTAFDDVPSSWRCPVCGAPKETFRAQTVTIAGFEDNQGYGFGTNQMTEGQKNLLIFGSLGAFVALFLLGYALE